MSSAPREEGVRSRRRRRRAHPHSNRTTPNHHNSESHLHNTTQPAPQSFEPGPDVPSPQSFHNIISHVPLQPTRLAYPAPHNDTPERVIPVQSPSAQHQQGKEEKSEDIEHTKRLQLRKEALARRGTERRNNLRFTQSYDGDNTIEERLSDSQLRQLDSSLKKCTGFVRKVRSLGFAEHSAVALRNEAANLNLSRYISEVVSAIAESRMRSSDVENLVLLCGEMHRRYEDFTPELVSALSALITSSSMAASSRDLSTRKAALRLLTDMFVLGMYTEIAPVQSVLKQLMKTSKDSLEEASNSLSILASFARFSNRKMLPVCSESAQEKKDIEQPESQGGSSWETEVLSVTSKDAILSALRSYFDLDVRRLLQDVEKELHKATIALTRSAQVRGTAEESAAQTYESSKLFHDKVFSSANILAQCIGKPAVELPTHGSATRDASTDNKTPQDFPHIVVSNPFSTPSKGKTASSGQDITMYGEYPFDREDQKAFYTALVPLDTKRLQEEAANHGNPQKQNSQGLPTAKGKMDADLEQFDASSGASAERKKHGSPSGGVLPITRPSRESRKKEVEKPLSIDKIIARLPTVETRDEADLFAQDFVLSAEGSRTGTKRLAKAVYSVSAQKLNLLPAYARIAATLQPVYPDVAAVVATNLEDDFRSLVVRSDFDEKHLAVCIKTAQYIGEYVKFGIISAPTLFELISLCMKDFSGQRVDVACHLLEACGRYTYLSPSSHLRMASILETLWRLKSVKNLEARHNTLIETAYFAVRLSPGSRVHKKETRPPIHEYVRHLIYNRLDATNIRWIHGQFMKLPWDEDLEQYVIKKFVKISRARYSTVPYVSTLIAAFQKQKPALVVGIVDALLESIRTGMEKNDGRDSQRRIAEIYLLGEMHKCGVIGETLVYNVLYQLITLGHESLQNSQLRTRRPPEPGAHDVSSSVGGQLSHRTAREGSRSAPDPPADFFRIRLACVLIECCGRVLVASNRRKLEVFWIFLERYMFCKTHQAGQGDRLPLHIGHVVGDVFESVLQKPRKVGKDARFSHPREDMSSRVGNREKTSDITYNQSRPFGRSSCLEEALTAVSMVERSGSDSALISVPARYVRAGHHPSIIAGSIRKPDCPRNGPTLFAPSPGSGIRGNFRDGFVTTSTGRAPFGDRGQWERHSNACNEQEAYEPSVSNSGVLEDADYPLFADDAFDSVETPMADDEDDEMLGNTGQDDMQAGESPSDEIMNDDDDERYDDNEDVTVEDEDVDDNDDEDDDDDDDDDEDEDEEDDVIFEHGLSRPLTEEEDAFAKELAAFTAAAVQSARASSSRGTRLDRMAIPMSLMTQKLEEEKAAAAAQAANAVHKTTPYDQSTSTWPVFKKRRAKEESVEFKMLFRRGGKSQLQGLQVPASSSLAVAAKESEFADAVRHEETKRLVLESSIYLNDDSDDLDDEVQLQAQQHAKERQESIRQQRSADEMELLSTLYRVKPRR